tara:strand:+ start:94 stop:465 length:372 start_codon:yes stop_codon:yes gene_type:complete
MVVKQLTAANYDELIKKSDKISIVKFWHKNCHMCNNLEPIYDALAERHADKFNFFHVNTLEDQGELATYVFDIEGVPEVYFIVGEDKYEIPFPDIPAPSGYPEDYLERYFLHYNNVLGFRGQE